MPPVAQSMVGEAEHPADRPDDVFVVEVSDLCCAQRDHRLVDLAYQLRDEDRSSSAL